MFNVPVGWNGVWVAAIGMEGGYEARGCGGGRAWGLGGGGDWSFLLSLIRKVQAVLSKMRYIVIMGRL